MAGHDNDNLCLLYHSNNSAKIAIKTSSGITDRLTIHKKVLQATVWAGLMCACTMDKMGKLAYNDNTLSYKYRSEVKVRPLEMIEDIITASNCGKQVIQTNSAVTTFVKLKKLTFSESKCSRIHVGKGKCEQFLYIAVNGKPIRESQK